MDVVVRDGGPTPREQLDLPDPSGVPSHVSPHVPPHVPSGAALAALRLSEEARGVHGLDVLRRSVDRAPPVLA